MIANGEFASSEVGYRVLPPFRALPVTSAFELAGKKLLEYILSPEARKIRGLEQITNTEKAVELCHALLNNTPQ